MPPRLDHALTTRILAVQRKQLLAPEPVERWVRRVRSDQHSRIAVLEIAGRDSIAAGVRVVEQGDVTHIVPSVVFNGATRGSPEDLEFALDVLGFHLPPGVVSDPVLVGDPAFWEALTVRNLDVILPLFGFYPGFIACHLYLHLIQVPMCRQLNVDCIVTGERETHDGEVKLSQTPEVLDAYCDAVASFGISLSQPLRKVESGLAVEEILAPRKWAAGAYQLRCVLSGAYKGPDGCTRYGPGRVYSASANVSYLHQFALPMGIEYIERVCAHEQVDSARLAAAHAERCDVEPR